MEEVAGFGRLTFAKVDLFPKSGSANVAVTPSILITVDADAPLTVAPRATGDRVKVSMRAQWLPAVSTIG